MTAENKRQLTFRLVLSNDLDHFTAAFQHGRRLIVSSVPQVNVVYLHSTRLTAHAVCISATTSV